MVMYVVLLIEREFQVELLHSEYYYYCADKINALLECDVKRGQDCTCTTKGVSTCRRACNSRTSCIEGEMLAVTNFKSHNCAV